MTTEWFLRCHHCDKMNSFDVGDTEFQCVGSFQGDTGCGKYTWINWRNGWPTGHDKPQKQATESDSKEN